MLAERVGPVNTNEIPRAIRCHQWSALNVPLLWAASTGDRDHPVLQWLLEVLATIPTVTVVGIDMSGPTAAVTGWEALRDVLHSRGVRSREDLAEQGPRKDPPSTFGI